MNRAIFLAALVLLAAPASALDCRNPMTQRDMNQCASDEYRAADAQLNETSGELMGMLDADQRHKLVAAERGWISERDAHCRSETAENAGGSMHPMLYMGCLTQMTMARTRMLRGRITCQQNRQICRD